MLDPIKIKQELTFIYNRNRLNVSITRARSKCVIILTDTLLAGSKEVMANPKTEAAFVYMQACDLFSKSIPNLRLRNS